MTALRGLRHRAGHAVHRGRRARRSGAPRARGMADRGRHRLSRALRLDRRGADDGRPRARAGRRHRGRDRRRTGAGDGRRDEQRHPPGGGRDPAHVRARRRRHPHARRPTTTSPRRKGSGRHFLAVADASTRPVCLYNVPGRTAVNLLPATALMLAEHPNVAGIKEASGDLRQIMEIIRHRPDGFAVLSGDDWLAFPVAAAGGDGLISVTSNEVPGADDRAGSPLARRGDLEAARRVPVPPPAAHGRQLPRDQSHRR